MKTSRWSWPISSFLLQTAATMALLQEHCSSAAKRRNSSRQTVGNCTVDKHSLPELHSRKWKLRTGCSRLFSRLQFESGIAVTLQISWGHMWLQKSLGYYNVGLLLAQPFFVVLCFRESMYTTIFNENPRRVWWHASNCRTQQLPKVTNRFVFCLSWNLDHTEQSENAKPCQHVMAKKWIFLQNQLFPREICEKQPPPHHTSAALIWPTGNEEFHGTRSTFRKGLGAFGECRNLVYNRAWDA